LQEAVSEGVREWERVAMVRLETDLKDSVVVHVDVLLYVHVVVEVVVVATAHRRKI
jgi:hypothetical protein